MANVFFNMFTEIVVNKRLLYDFSIVYLKALFLLLKPTEVYC